MQKAKLFWSGRSQAVRLPKEFRFEGTEVRIRRHGNKVILEPIADDWAWLDALPGKLFP
jgi:antitoxin VapB